MSESDEKIPRLHQSHVQTLLERSPLHAFCEWKAREEKESGASEDMDRGTIIDRLLLAGPDLSKVIVEIKRDNFMTKIAREERDEARAAGMIPIISKKLPPLKYAAEALKARLVEKGVSLTGKSHVKLEWSSPTTGCPCAGELDHLIFGDNGDNSATIYDIKTSRNASHGYVEKAMTKFGSHIQRAAYVDAVETLYPQVAGRVTFIFVYCEFVKPFDILKAEPDGMMRTLGTAQWTRACLKWQECLERNKWPGYTNEVVRISAKPWALSAEMEAGEPAEED